MNQVKITGYIAEKNIKTKQFDSGKTLTEFGFKIYNGKKNGENQFAFINVKHWGVVNNTQGEKTIEGFIAVDQWEKDGVKQSRTYIKAMTVSGQDESKAEIDNDDLPF